MALIKKPNTTKVKLVDKTVSLPASTWKKLNEYAKYIGMAGRPADKVNYIVEQALEAVFEMDKEFNAPKVAEKPQPEAKPETKTGSTQAKTSTK